MPNPVTENKDQEDDNDFVICTNEDYMSDGYNGDSEWEDLPPAATYSEQLTKRKITAQAAAMRHAEEIFDGRKDKTGVL